MPVSLFRQLTSLPVWFLVGFLLAYGLMWLDSKCPDSYRIVGGRIQFTGSKRRLDFESIEHAKLQDFGAFRVIALAIRDLGTVLLGAPAELDFEKLRNLFESRGISFATSETASRWPERTAILEFEQLVSSTRSHAKSLSKAKRDAYAGPPGAIVLLRSAIIYFGLIGILMTLGLFFRRSNDDWDSQMMRFKAMNKAAIEAKKAAGDDWPRLRPQFVGPLDIQAEIVKAGGRRTLNLAYVAGIFSFVAFFGVFYVILETCFAWLDDS
ncbi:hypothetical protein GC170_18565 [bacterium]|nr:hypothetical protein [bacterium]